MACDDLMYMHVVFYDVFNVCLEDILSNEIHVYVKHDSLWIMINVVWASLEVKYMNILITWKVCSHVLTHTMNEKMNLMNENGWF